MKPSFRHLPVVLLPFVIAAAGAVQDSPSDGLDRLVAAILGTTPMIDDLEELTDTIGGRVTGSEANVRAVAWAIDKFEQAGAKVTAEDFEMP